MPLPAASLLLASGTNAADTAPTLLVDLLVILLAAALVAMVATRLKLSIIPAYLIVGAIIGPNALGIVSDPDNVEEISNIAILLLLFGIGLQLELSGPRRALVIIVLIGGISTFASVILGWFVGMALGLPWAASLAIAMALSNSSTAVVLRLLMEHREVTRLSGRLIFSTLLVQDLLVVAMLAILPALAPGDAVELADGQARLHPVLQAIVAIAGVALLIVIGRLCLPRVFMEAARTRSSEVMLVTAGGLALGAALFTAWLGFSLALGAFLAGLLLGWTPFRHQISGQIGPLRDVLMALFFTAVGLSVDPATIAELWWAVGLGTIALVVVKLVAIGGTAWILGTSAPVALVVGASLSQSSEFSLVVLNVAREQGIVDADAHAAAVAVVVLSLVLTPTLYTRSRRLAGRLSGLPTAPWMKRAAVFDTPARRTTSKPGTKAADPDGSTPEQTTESEDKDEAAPQPSRPPGHIVIAGYGVVGRAVATRLLDMGIPWLVVELNPSTVRRQHALGHTIVYGDISNPDVQESAGLGRAEAVILTIPDDDAMIRACQGIRAQYPNIFIAARTTFLSRAMQATQAGANHVTVEEIATAEAMAKQVIEELEAHRKQAGLADSETGTGGGSPAQW